MCYTEQARLDTKNVGNNISSCDTHVAYSLDKGASGMSDPNGFFRYIYSSTFEVFFHRSGSTDLYFFFRSRFATEEKQT